MSIEFKYLAPDPVNPAHDKEYTVPYADGNIIPDVQFRVDELPSGFPTRRYNLTPITGTYQLTSNVVVESNRITLVNYQNPPDIYPIHNMFFKDGLPASVKVGSSVRRGKFYPVTQSGGNKP